MKIFGHKILKILSVNTENYLVSLKFKGGVTGTVSLSNIFNKPKGLVREILKGNMFHRCFIESGALAWPNGFELCPDTLLMLIQQQKKGRFVA
jgi:hypothetical protein